MKMRMLYCDFDYFDYMLEGHKLSLTKYYTERRLNSVIFC